MRCRNAGSSKSLTAPSTARPTNTSRSRIPLSLRQSATSASAFLMRPNGNSLATVSARRAVSTAIHSVQVTISRPPVASDRTTSGGRSRFLGLVASPRTRRAAPARLGIPMLASPQTALFEVAFKAYGATCGPDCRWVSRSRLRIVVPAITLLPAAFAKMRTRANCCQGRCVFARNESAAVPGRIKLAQNGARTNHCCVRLLT